MHVGWGLFNILVVLRHVPYRCKVRFCTTCSCRETEEWGRFLEQDVFQVNHRHVVFTIDEGLREVFLRHREKLMREFIDEAVQLQEAST
ncbi:transposase zinc-binding domain-containing protein [Paenibacillus sp. HJGM_3]|uniref:transposase zinc-binding domain-containing protein n=1 Tax=Paenibacillus sp. HJGM_3 TaxID=3379816 RepID=UPI00385DD48B